MQQIEVNYLNLVGLFATHMLFCVVCLLYFT